MYKLTLRGPLARLFVLTTALLACALPTSQAAGPVAIKFTLDWRFEGPAAPFLMAEAKGYFAAEGLNVTIDAGNGSAGAVTRVATGAYDMGFADFNALVEYDAKGAENKIQGVYMTYNSTPAAVFTLKQSGVAGPADLVGKTLAAPVFDAGRKAWPAFAKANGLAVDAVTWQTVEPAIRETLLARGSVDGITGFYFTSLLNLEARGVKPEDIVALRYPDYGVELYGNTVIASQKLLTEQPEAVAAFLRAVNKAWLETIADPDAAVAYVRQRDPLIDVALETRRLRLALETVVITPETRANGLGDVDMARLTRSVAAVVEAFELPATPDAAALFTTAFLPLAAERAIP